MSGYDDTEIIDYEEPRTPQLLPSLPEISGGALRFIAVSATAILFAGGGYIAYGHDATVLAAMLLAAAVASIGYGAVLYNDWRVDRRDVLQARRDVLRFARERQYLDAQLALGALEIKRIEALKIDAGGRQSLYLDGRLITAPRNHAEPANVPHSYHVAITHAPSAQVAQLAPGPSIDAQELPAKIDLMTGLNAARARWDYTPADLPLYLGESSGGAIVAATVDILMAALVAGSGGGKSMFLRSLLAQWYLHFLGGQAISFVLIDHDRRELPKWSKAKNLYQWVNPETGNVEPAFSDYGERTSDLITSLYEEMERRAKLSEDDRERLPFVIVAIEEVIDVFGEISPEARTLLEKLMRRSRAVNFRVVCTAQYLRVSDVGKAVQSQSRSKFAGNLADDPHTARALGFDAKLVPAGKPGRFTFRLPDGATGTIQTPFIDAGAIAELLARPVPSTARPGPSTAQGQPPIKGELLLSLATVDGPPDMTGEPLPPWVKWTAQPVPSTIETAQPPAQDATPRPGPKETKEDAARRLWQEGYTSIRKLSDELTRLGYSGVSSPDSARALINRLGLRNDD